MADLPELSTEAEALFADWPVAHRPELNWDAFATQTLARAQSDASGIDATLLAAPALEPEAGEPSIRTQQARTTTTPASADGVQSEPDLSLRELALASLAAVKAEESHTDIAQQALSTSRKERVSQPSFHDIPRTSEIRAAKIDLHLVSSAHGSQAPAASVRVEQPARQPTEPRGRMVLVAVLGLAAAAAGLVLWQSNQDGGPIAEAPASAPPTEPATAAARAPTSARAPATRLSVEPLLAEASAPTVPRGYGGAPSVAGSGPRLASLAKAAPVPAATAAPAATEEPDDPRLVPAAKPENLPLEPSTGAALAAVGRVMGGAKACVAGSTASSTATLTFASSGKVQSVAVSPPAAGTAAEACIRSALSGARVGPFAKPAFTIRVPIRP